MQRPRSTGGRRADTGTPPAPPVATGPSCAREIVAAGGCAAVAAGVYAATLCPTVAGGDSGELIAAAHVLGVVHPPGYPLYTLLGKLVTLIPAGTIAWRVNLLSALCDAGAAFLLCRAAVAATQRLFAGILAAGAFAFSPLVWPYAVTAEVFALNNLFVAGLLWLTLRAVADPAGNSWRIPVAGLWLGLGLSNHHTLVFFGAPVLLFLVRLDGARALQPRALARLGCGLAAGLVPYLHLVVASRAAPPIQWGDAATWHGFLDHLLRRDYGTFRLASAGTGAAGQLVPWLELFVERFGETSGWIGPPLVLAGAWSLKRRSPTRAVTALWLAVLAAYLLVFSTLANLRVDEALHVTALARFWQQAVVVAAWLMGLGLAEVTRGLGSVRGPASGWLVAVAQPLLLVSTGFAAMDHTQRVFLREYGAAILAEMPPDALLLITSDEAIGSVVYLQQVEGLRPDVRVIPTGQLGSPWFRRLAERRFPGVGLPAGAFSARAFIDANASRFPILLVNRIPWLETLEQAYSPWPVGLADRVLPKGVTPALPEWVAGLEASLGRFDAAAGLRFEAGSWERHAAAACMRQYQRSAVALARAAAARGNDAATASLLVRALEPLAERLRPPDPALFKNLGVAYQFLARSDPRARAGMVRHWRRYLEVAPKSDADLAAIRSLLAAAER